MLYVLPGDSVLLAHQFNESQNNNVQEKIAQNIHKEQLKTIKTLIVETAIETVLEDLHTRGLKGDIHKRLITTESEI